MNGSVDGDCVIEVFLCFSASELWFSGCIERSPIISAIVTVWAELWHVSGGTGGFCRDIGRWLAKYGSTTTGCTSCERIELACASDSAKSSNGSMGPRKFVALNSCGGVGHDTGGNVEEVG